MAFCTAIAAYETLAYWGAPQPITAAALTLALAEWAALMLLWSQS